MNKANIVIGAASISIDGVDAGHTQGGVKLRPSNEKTEVISDQVCGVVAQAISMQRFFIETTLLEATLNNLRMAFNESASQQFSGSGLRLGSATPTITEHVVVVTGKAPPNMTKTRTCSFTRCVSIEEVEFNIGQRDAASVIPVKLEVLKNDDGTFGSMVES